MNTSKTPTSSYENSFMGFPKQRIPFSEKGEEWVKKCTYGIIGANAGGNTLTNGNNNYKRIKHNFDLINGKINDDDYTYVTDPYGNSENYGKPQARLKSYNLIMGKINYFLSKEYEMPFNFRVYCNAGGGYNARLEHKKQMFLQFLNESIKRQQVELGLISPEEAESQEYKSPEELEYYNLFSYEGEREKYLNLLLKITYNRDGLKDKFNKCFKYAAASAREIMHVGIVNGKLSYRPVNPLFFNYVAHSEIEFIEDSQACSEIRMMNVGQIIDELGEYLTEAQIDEIERGNFFSGVGNMMNNYVQAGIVPDDYDYYSEGLYANIQRDWAGIPVTYCNWKSMKKISYISYIDENNEIQEFIISEEDKLPKELKPFIVNKRDEWITDIWESCMIGSTLVYGRPIKNQIMGKLNYIGTIYNSMNSEATSIVDLLSPHMKAYNIIWLRFEEELARAKGKKFIMDLAQLPKSQGWSVEQWFHYFETHNIAWINSAEEGNFGDNVAKYNQFTSVDMTLSGNVQGYFTALREIERLMNDIVGLSPQAMAQIAASETATGINAAIGQTSLVTKMWFVQHNMFKKRVIEHIIETYKITVAEGTQTINWVDDNMYQQISIDGEKLGDSDYGLYISDNVKDQELFDLLKNQAQAMLQNNLLSVSDLIKIYKNESVSDIEATIKYKELKAQESQQQQIAHEQEMVQQAQALEQQRHDEEMMFKMEQLDREDINKQLDRDNKIQLAEISALGFAKEPDADANGVPDVIEQGKLALEQSRANFDQQAKYLEHKRKENELTIKNKNENEKISLEKEKLKQQKYLELEKLKVAREDIKSKVKIAKQNKNKYDK